MAKKTMKVKGGKEERKEERKEEGKERQEKKERVRCSTGFCFIVNWK